MTDKVQKIREEVARIQLYTQSETLKQVLDYIDEVQKEEIPPKFPLISPKKCMYTKDDFTDEDRKVLCDGCKEECEYAQKEEPAPKIFEDMLNAITPAESLDILAEEHDKIIDLCLYGKEPEMVDIDDLPKEEPVSEDLRDEEETMVYQGEVYTRVYKDELDKFANKFVKSVPKPSRKYARYSDVDMVIAVKEGANWQKTKDESATDDLGEYINELSKQFPEVSFAKLSRIAVRVAKWQREQIKEALLSEVLPCFMHGGEADEVVAKLDEVLNQKK